MVTQYSCLGNSMNRGAQWATVPGVTKSRTQLRDKDQTLPGQCTREATTMRGLLTAPREKLEQQQRPSTAKDI